MNHEYRRQISACALHGWLAGFGPLFGAGIVAALGRRAGTNGGLDLKVSPGARPRHTFRLTFNDVLLPASSTRCGAEALRLHHFAPDSAVGLSSFMALHADLVHQIRNLQKQYIPLSTFRL